MCVPSRSSRTCRRRPSRQSGEIIGDRRAAGPPGARPGRSGVTPGEYSNGTSGEDYSGTDRMSLRRSAMTSESLNFLTLSPLRPLNILSRSSFVWRSQAKARGSADVAKLLPCAHIPWKAAMRTVFTQEDDAAGAIAWRHVADPLRPRFLKLAALMD